MSSDQVEHLSSVHNNPFIRQFGLPQHNARQETADSEYSVPSSASSDRGDDDPEQEYHVNSGFVNKLRSKFAQLENKSTKVTLSRKSASVENLLNISSSSSKNTSSKLPPWQKDDSSVSASSTTVDFRKPVGYKPQIKSRPRSYELESTDPDKHASAKKKEIQLLKQNNVIRSVKPPLPKKTVADSSKKKIYSRKSNSDTVVPKLEHHDWKVAPDLEKIGRDNLVIIESKESSSVNKEKTKSVSDTNEDLPDGFKRVKPLVEKESVHDENELPKPNTVSQFRTLFEKTNKMADSLSVWRHSSPPRKSSGSDTNSPNVTSPVSTPRSPLVKMNDDNVFDDIPKINSIKEQGKSNSPRNSSNLDTNISSPRNSSSLTEYAQNVDTTSTSLQKSLEMFRRRGSEDMGKKSDTSRNSYSEKDSDTNSSRPLSPSVQHTLTPVHPMSKVFDSKSLSKKTEKPKRPKPSVLAKKHHPVPKDTLELKHEADKRKQQELEQEKKRESLTLNDVKEMTEMVNSEAMSEESKIKPSSKQSGKSSPRKTQIFDSNNMVKKSRDPPKVIHRGNGDVPSKTLSNNVPKTVSIEIKDLDDTKANSENLKEVPMEVSPLRPSYQEERKSGGLTEIKPNIIEAKDNKTKPRKFKVKEQNFIKAESVTEVERKNPVVQTSGEKSEAPVSGMSSFLASRLKKTQPDQQNQLKTSSVHLANGSSPSPVPRKRQAPERPVSNGSSNNVEADTGKAAPPLPSSPEPQLPKTNIDDILNRQKKKTSQPATKMVFDSSKIANKRKEPPKRKPPRKNVDQINASENSFSNNSVPKLDLSSITGESEYQEGYIPTIIKPCPYIFHGAEVTFEKTPYKKTRKVKVCYFIFVINYLIIHLIRIKLHKQSFWTLLFCCFFCRPFI